MLVERLAELAEARDRHAGPAGDDIEAASDGCLNRLEALRRHPDRRVRLLPRRREDRRFRDLVVGAVVAERLPLQRQQGDVNLLPPARTALLQVDAEAPEPVVLIAPPPTDVEPATAQQVGGCA